MFSPWYAWARRRGPADPVDHCALNVSLLGPRGARWAMTERGRGAVSRTADTLAIGPSSVRWDGDRLTFCIDEITAPVPRRVRGTVRVHLPRLTGHAEVLDAAGRHRWRPIAPDVRVEVAMDAPALHWSGPGYLDSNDGDAPLERDFVQWQWSRARLRERVAILYEGERTDGSAFSVALACGRDGVERFAPPSVVALPTSFWRMGRRTRADGAARVVRTMEDSPFYVRSVLATSVLGERAEAVHESVSLARFARPWMQAMLPFRAVRAVW